MNSTSKPTHKVLIVENREGADADQPSGFWTRVGSAWPSRDGRGLNIQLVPGIAVHGRLIVRENDDDERQNTKSK